MELTLEQLKEIYPNGSLGKMKAFIADFNRYKWLHKITDILDIAAFVSQIGHETAELQFLTEIADGSAYEGRKDLGNIVKGDGKRFKGTGHIMLTGRENYLKFTKWYNENFLEKQDFVEHPELIANYPSFSFLTAVYFWQAHNLSELAKKGKFKQITRIINGGYNGYNSRLKLYNRAILVLSSPS